MSLTDGTPTSTAPAVEVVRPRGYAGTLAGACAAVLVAQVANALPASLLGPFQQDLHTRGTELTWITAAFMVAVVVFEFTFGMLGDLFGRKRLVAAGSALVVVGAVVSATAPNVHVLWVGAALDGLGAGAMFPGSLALVAALARTEQQRARAIALWAGFLSAGAAISPLVGGVLAGAGSWRTSYWVLVGFALASLLLTLTLCVESSAPEGRRLDVPGQITFALGLILVLYAAVQGPADGWASPSIVAAFAVGAAFLVAFVLIERRARSPILKLSLFTNRAFSVTSAVTVIGMFSFLGADYATAMWLGPVQHQGPVRIGLLFLLLQGPAFVLIPLISRLLVRVNPRWMLTAGLLLLAAGALLSTQLDVTNPSLAPFILPDTLLGIGFALSISSFTAVALNTVPLHLAGMSSATTNMLRDLGFALGPVIVGAVGLSGAADTFSTGLRDAHLPPDQLAAAAGIGRQGGPIAVGSLPSGAPGSAAHGIALESLGSGFTVAFAVCGIAALVAAVLTAVGMIGIHGTQPETEPLSEPLRQDLAAAVPSTSPYPTSAGHSPAVPE